MAIQRGEKEQKPTNFLGSIPFIVQSISRSFFLVNVVTMFENGTFGYKHPSPDLTEPPTFLRAMQIADLYTPSFFFGRLIATLCEGEEP